MFVALATLYQCVHACGWNCEQVMTGRRAFFQEQLQERPETSNKRCAHLFSILECSTVSTKCSRLRQNMSYFNVLDFHQFLPHLLSNIFGFDQTIGWGLRYLTTSHPEFELVYSFLSPGGDLFDLLFKLDDKEFSYEFPLGCLPYSTEDVDHVKQYTTRPILLSAIEYYFYHFSYYIVQCQLQQSPMISTVQDSLYIHLFEAYLNIYLPFWGVIPISPRFLQLKEDQMKLGYTHADTSKSPLLSVYKSEQSKVLETPSERFVEILMKFWINDVIQNEDVLNLSQTTVNPSSELLLLLRRLMKHIHYFANGVTVTSEVSSQFGEEVHITEALRRSIFSPSLRRRLFQYLQSCLRQCAVDSSYRYIVELWLTYVQPWRYTDPTQASEKGDQFERLSPTWKSFILDNFPFYSTLLMDFFGRCQSFEFATYICVILVYRVAKVFAQSDLTKILKLGEALLLNIGIGQRDLKDFFVTAPHSIKSSFIECCGPEFMYTPLFHERSVQDVQRLVSKISMSRDMVKIQTDSGRNSPAVLDRTAERSADHRERSVLNRVAGYFTVDDDSSLQKRIAEETDSDVKLISMLDTTVVKLLQMYQIPDPYWMENDASYIQEHCYDSTSLESWSAEGDVKDTRLLQCSKLKISYRGNPLLQPLRSYENPALARLLYRTSSRLNTMFSSQLSSIGSSNNILCKGLKSLLYTPPSSHDGTSPLQDTRTRAPQINLRPFASYYSLLYLFVVLLFASLFSMPYFLSAFLLLFTSLYIMKYTI